MLRIVLISVLAVAGMLGISVGIAQAVDGFGDAGTLASAPVCAAGVDVTTVTEDCVGTMNLLAEDGVFDDDGDGGGASIELDLPPAGSYNAAYPSFPGNALFDAAVGDGETPAVVRAEFWKGQIVTLTAGKQGVTVTTNQNPNNVGGVGLGMAVMSLASVLLALLLLVGVRAIRLRWLLPGVVLRLTVSGLCVWCLGTFVAGVCLVNQPARVAEVAVIAPLVTLGLTALLWLLLSRVPKRQLRHRYSYR